MSRRDLAYAAVVICGDAGLRDPQRFVSKRLCRGEFRGIKIARQWFMTDADIAAAIETLRNPAPTPKPADAQPISVVDGLSQRSRRRVLRSVQ